MTTNPLLSLHGRVSTLLVTMTLLTLIVLGGGWVHNSRDGIHEEMEAATRVSVQWLHMVEQEWQELPVEQARERVLVAGKALGRIRAQILEIEDLAGNQIYCSPPSTYKAGRQAPAWFMQVMSPALPVFEMQVGGLRLRLTPDASRAVLDAWDQAVALVTWAGVFLLGLYLLLRWALVRVLAPLEQLSSALDRLAAGHFETRLPPLSSPELRRVGAAFNSMADRLALAVNENVRLETAQQVQAQLAERIEQYLDRERQDIARELHDELAQGVTAVRALAGAIVQRSELQPQVKEAAQCIVESTGAIQTGVRQILCRLHQSSGQWVSLDEQLRGFLERWRRQHPDIHLVVQGDPLMATPPEWQKTVLRLVQEGMTNVVRHASASKVHLQWQLGRMDDGTACLCLRLHDNGRGTWDDPARETAVPPPALQGCGLGLPGMRARVASLGGQLGIEHPGEGGFVLNIQLPILGGELCRME